MKLKHIIKHFEQTLRKVLPTPTPFTPERFVLIGLGGIGSNLVTNLARFSTYRRPPLPIVLIDGKSFRIGNQIRQHYYREGTNKAISAAEDLQRIFPDLDIRIHEAFITSSNASLFIKERDIVLSCLDNHSSRRDVSHRIEVLKNGILISGGNELVDGNVQIHIRNCYRDLTPPITYFHPEIAEPTDRNPADIGCNERVESTPQLLPTNALVASLMLAALSCTLNWSTGKSGLPAFDEQYFDIPSGNVKSYKRRTERK